MQVTVQVICGSLQVIVQVICGLMQVIVHYRSSSSRMRVIYHNWSATKQRALLPREVETWLPDCGVTH